MQLTEVKSARDRRDFLSVPLGIYRDDPSWICPLDKDIEAVFDENKNTFFQHGEAVRWILKDSLGRSIGRVAAFVNRNTAFSFEQPTGGMGFFECINDQEAAFRLFEACKNWLESRGMEAMDGPINFGEKDKWWGLLTEGFHPPAYCMNYNPPWYRKFFEAYGFQPYYEQYNYLLDLRKPAPERFMKIAGRTARDPGYRCERVKAGALKKYAADFRTIYNQAWVKHDNFKPMSEAQSLSMIRTIKPIMDPDYIWFAYYREEPIGFFIMLPEINEIIRQLHGRMNWWSKLQFLYLLKTRKTRRIFGIAFGIVPGFQAKGVEALLVSAAARGQEELKRYDELELTWIGDFNPSMLHLMRLLEAGKYRTFITFRKIFNPEKSFNKLATITS